LGIAQVGPQPNGASAKQKKLASKRPGYLARKRPLHKSYQGKTRETKIKGGELMDKSKKLFFGLN
jgi:hypothetical protein